MNRDAHIRVPEIGLGMNRSWQSVPRMLADDRISTTEAYEWRLMEQVVDAGTTVEAAMALANKIAAQPRKASRLFWSARATTAAREQDTRRRPTHTERDSLAFS